MRNTFGHSIAVRVVHLVGERTVVDEGWIFFEGAHDGPTDHLDALVDTLRDPHHERQECIVGLTVRFRDVAEQNHAGEVVEHLPAHGLELRERFADETVAVHVRAEDLIVVHETHISARLVRSTVHFEHVVPDRFTNARERVHTEVETILHIRWHSGFVGLPFGRLVAIVGVGVLIHEA